MTFKETIKLVWLPVCASLLCCVSPILIAVLGIGSVSLAYSYADILYGEYKWVFRIAGLLLLVVALWSYFRKAKNICTLDQAKRRKNEVVNTSLIALAAFVIGYFLFYHFLNGLVSVLERASRDLQTPEAPQVRRDEQAEQREIPERVRAQFREFKTDLARASIPFDQILSGGPGKDGIPALHHPRFTDIARADNTIHDTTPGILIEGAHEVRFYPYNILLWHETVNDEIDGKKFAITFCPLCGSALVFDRMVDEEELIFNVSGFLYESNLLMYDTATESLWSQILGQAVVGSLTGTKLAHVPFEVIDFLRLKARFPEARVLSTDTGFTRDYSLNPYGAYDSSEELYFPVSFTDTRLPLKEPMYIVDIPHASVALRLSRIPKDQYAEVPAGSVVLEARAFEDGNIVVRDTREGKELPGYFALWFSWAVHHQENGIVWVGER